MRFAMIRGLSPWMLVGVWACSGSGPTDGADCDEIEAYADRDGDGYGAGEVVRICVEAFTEGGWAEGSGDCDDARADVYPGAADAWYDGVDHDCAGNDDYDQDGDGASAYGAPTGSADDCFDEDPERRPGVALNDPGTGVIGAEAPTLWSGEPWVADLGPAQVLTPTDGSSEHHATVAWTSDGHIAVAYQLGSGNAAEARAMLLDDDLNVTVVPFSVHGTGMGGKPDVEANAFGVWVTWQNNNGGVAVRRYTEALVSLGDAAEVFTSDLEAEGPDLALTEDGTVSVVWNVDGDPTALGYDAYRTFDPNLEPLTEAVSLKATGRSVADAVPVGAGLVSVGTDKATPPDGMVATVYGVRVDSDGCQWEFRADGGGTDWPSRPAVDEGEGTLAVAWRQKTPPSDGTGAYGRLFDESGVALGPPLELMPLPNDGNRVVVRVFEDTVLYAWEASEDGVLGVHAWLLDRQTGQARMDRIRVSDPLEVGERPSIDVRAVADGVEAIVTWETPDGLGGHYLMARRVTFRPDGP